MASSLLSILFVNDQNRGHFISATFAPTTEVFCCVWSRYNLSSIVVKITVREREGRTRRADEEPKHSRAEGEADDRAEVQVQPAWQRRGELLKKRSMSMAIWNAHRFKHLQWVDFNRKLSHKCKHLIKMLLIKLHFSHAMIISRTELAGKILL